MSVITKLFFLPKSPVQSKSSERPEGLMMFCHSEKGKKGLEASSLATSGFVLHARKQSISYIDFTSGRAQTSVHTCVLGGL